MEFLKILEGIRTPFLDRLFYFLTYGGEEIMLLGLICILYWCVNKKLAYRMMFVYLPSALVVNTLKISLRIERPWVRDPSFTIVEKARASATGYSFPSGHTQNAVSLFGTLAYAAKKLWIRILFIAVIGLVMLSRMYLGVHTPADVITAFAVTAVIAVVINLAADRLELNKKRRLIIALVIIGLGVIYTVFSIILLSAGKLSYANAADGFKGIGGGFAFAICWYVESTYVDFDTKCEHIWQQILKVVIGAGGVMLIRSGIKAAFDSGIVIDMLRYFLMVCWAMLVMPLIIKRFFAGVKKADGEPA